MIISIKHIYNNKFIKLLDNDVPENSKYYKFASCMRFDVQKDDTLDIKLYAGEVTYEDIYYNHLQIHLLIYIILSI